MTPAWLVALAALASAPGAEGDLTLARRKVETGDGYALALYRYCLGGPGMAAPPVLLVPDVGMGREAYDLQGSGLAPFLAQHGRDVFVLELRGQGSANTASWALADWVSWDLPAAVAAVAKAHPGPLDLVVQGYAGGVVLGTVARELKAAVRRVVALNAVVEGSPPNAWLEDALEGGRLGRLSLDARRFDRLLARGGRFAPGRLAALRRSGFVDLPPAVAKQLLGWMTSGDLTLPGASLKERLQGYATPTLLILALLDDFAPPELASALRDLAPRAPVQAKLLSRFELLQEDYSHLSMLHGASASSDVWAPVLDFLRDTP